MRSGPIIVCPVVSLFEINKILSGYNPVDSVLTSRTSANFIYMESVRMLYLEGKSGKKYRFYSFPSFSRFKKAGGVYVLTNRVRDNQKLTHKVLHVGSTEDLSMLNEMYSGPENRCKEGANCVIVKIEDNSDTRLETFEDLRSRYLESAAN